MRCNAGCAPAATLLLGSAQVSIGRVEGENSAEAQGGRQPKRMRGGWLCRQNPASRAHRASMRAAEEDGKLGPSSRGRVYGSQRKAAEASTP
jgi:hypothetical protein